MQETEKIEIMNFDQEGYLADGKAAVEAGKKMAQIADRVADEGYDAVLDVYKRQRLLGRLFQIYEYEMSDV